MSEKAFRLDFFVAIAALLISATSACALIYQTRIVSDQSRLLADQYAATIWPYLSVASTYTPETGEVLTVENDGLGPALIRSAQLSVDGKPISGWGGYLATIMHDRALQPYLKQEASLVRAGGHVSTSITLSSLGRGSTLRPGESKTLLVMNLSAVALRSVIKHAIAVDLCYCSLNKSCWKLHSDQRDPDDTSDPRPIAQCNSAAMIAAPNS